MKKFTLLLCALGIVSLSFGQVLQTAQDALVNQEKEVISLGNADFKAGGDTIWFTSFDWADASQERGWSLPEGWEIADLTDFGMPWVWRNDTLNGNFTTQSAPAHFPTAEDGFMAVPVDEYNAIDGVTSSNASDTYLQTPPIDCSSSASVMVNFNHLFRLCCSNYNLEMLVTNDDGVHWALYDVRFGVDGNTVTPVKFRSPQINISDVAAGMSNVQIRFYIHGPSHYYWMLDDLVLTEAYENDLVLEDTWAEFNGGFDERIGHINYWPMSQLGLEAEVGGNIGDYLFRAALLNNGMVDQENTMLQTTILKNGEQVYEDVSEPTVIWPLDRDTVEVVSTFLADDYADYHVSFEAISDNPEEVPTNNSASVMFTVTDTLMHRADFSAESGANTGGWTGGSNAGDMVGVGYDLYVATEMNAITSYIYNVTDADFPTYQYVLMKYLEEEDLYIEWLTSDIYSADSTIARSWQTHEIEKDGETEFLEPGFYLACVRLWGDDGSDEGSNGLSIGWDKDAKYRGSYTYMYQAASNSEYSTGKMNQIGIVINEEGGPVAASVTFNVDMNAHIANDEFNINSDFVDVAGSFNNWEGSAQMTDEDGDGIYTITIDNVDVAALIEYKYRINANWDTSEFPAGGPNRTYTVRYWNILDDVYNGGETTGVEDLALIESLIVYPNPTQGDFTVKVSNTEATSISISLIDIQGHVVYENRLEGVISHTETIENKFSKGIYFLSVNNGKEVKVKKVIVQ
ncbi:MAG: T9SS type A sorting domain-containing protein [Bacteroidetes bacterium]|jgi:hypothetical protein|nr:T9SS type A sorting domain-containing protein [Bacteroidota bacterium]MBT4401548.1 T9SS type A sorting domain-containing protein [Bacteroidota bacterium]MBT7093646.1 T9SS type A sorting domain-containing protein [Bacteroidota bacterium]MBT7464412.1 T9SS type A sorting domain-containing protein [Bacteroidota bacterium]